MNIINFGQLRRKMVEKQLIKREIKNENVLKAMLEVPRHLFVSDKYLEYAYQDSPLPIEEGQTISQPYIVARMVQELAPEEDHKVMEIGTGSGYATAVLSQISKKVYTIERHEKLAKQAITRYQKLGYDNNIEVKIGDGTKGWEEKAPYDRILVSAGAPVVPEELIKQLNIEGIMIIPVGEEKKYQKLLQITKVSDNEVKTKELEAVRFVPLIGDNGWEK